MVFMGQTTPRVLDGAVDSVVKRSEEIDNSHEEHEQDKQSKGDKDMNNMQTFFAKVWEISRSYNSNLKVVVSGARCFNNLRLAVQHRYFTPSFGPS